MTAPEIQELLNYADESHQAAKVLIDSGFIDYLTLSKSGR